MTRHSPITNAQMVNSDKAYEYLRRQILAGTLPPGRQLATGQLSTEIGVSRTPVRDALRKLEADGLVEIRARYGAMVKAIDTTELVEMCELRLLLESYAAGRAAVHRTASDLEAIEVPLQRMRQLTSAHASTKDEAPLLEELRKEDVRFHLAIITASRNKLVKKEILRLHLIHRIVTQQAAHRERATMAARVAHRKEVLKSHELIFEAILKGNQGAAKRAMEEHIQEMINSTFPSLNQPSVTQSRELTPEESIYLG